MANNNVPDFMPIDEDTATFSDLTSFASWQIEEILET